MERAVWPSALCTSTWLNFNFPIFAAQPRLSDKPTSRVVIVNMVSHTHAHTDEAGSFLLRNTKPGDCLKVSHVGFQTQTVAAASKDLQLVLAPASFQLNEVVVSEGINHLSSVSTVDLQTNPVNSAQELLRKVPGLFIGQHAGGGKAEQLFLRGFDLNETQFATTSRLSNEPEAVTEIHFTPGTPFNIRGVISYRF